MYIILVSAGKQPSQQFSKLAKLSELESQQDDEEHLDLDLQGGESTSTNKESTAGSVPPSSSSSKQNHIGPSSFDESKDDIGATGKLNGYPLGSGTHLNSMRWTFFILKNQFLIISNLFLNTLLKKKPF